MPGPSINPYKPSGGGALPAVHIPGLVKLADNRAEGMSQDDSSNPADGSLYPTNLPTSITAQSQITSLFSTEAQQYYALDDENYAVNASKLKVAEKFFGAFKKLQGILYAAFTNSAIALTSSTLYITDVIKGEWLDSTRYAMLYLDESSGIILKFVVGTIQADGSMTWGTPVSVKTYTDATHRNLGFAGFAKTDTDKVLVTYSNKVSTNYWMKGRVITISAAVCTLQAESTDLVNWGAGGTSRSNATKIRGASGAGAVVVKTPNASGTNTVSRIAIMQHDNANTVTVGTLLDPTLSDFDAGFYSWATDKFVMMIKVSGTTHVYVRAFTVSGTTITATGSGLVQVTDSTSGSSYVITTSGFIDFGSNILGMIFSNAGQMSIIPISVASDIASKAGNATQLGINADQATKGVALADGSGLIYGVVNSGGNPIVNVRAFYSNGVITVTSYVVTPVDSATSNYLTHCYISSNRAMFFSTQTNASSTIYYQIGAGDCSIQILDQSNNVLATITETNDGGGQVKWKSLNLTNAALFSAGRMILKLKNTSSQARKIRISGIYANVE